MSRKQAATVFDSFPGFDRIFSDLLRPKSRPTAKRPAQGSHKVLYNSDLDAVIAMVSSSLDQFPDNPLVIQIAGGKTQTKHAHRRFFARLKATKPAEFSRIASALRFVSAREEVIERAPPVRPERVSAGRKLKLVPPKAEPKLVSKAVELKADDGPLHAYVQQMQALMREAGIERMVMAAASPVVTIEGFEVEP